MNFDVYDSVWERSSLVDRWRKRGAAPGERERGSANLLLLPPYESLASLLLSFLLLLLCDIIKREEEKKEEQLARVVRLA